MAFFAVNEIHVAGLEANDRRQHAIAGLAALAAHALLAAFLLLGLVHQTVNSPKASPTTMVNIFNNQTQTASLAPPAPTPVRIAPVTALQPEIVIQPEPRISPSASAVPVSAPATSTLDTAIAMPPAGGGSAAGARVTGAGGGGADGYDDSAYRARVAAHIQRYLRLPYLPSASVRNSNPLVMVHLVWTRDGMVEKVELFKSSGHSRVDDAAIAAVQRAQPLPPIPPQMIGPRYNSRIPIVFEYRWIPPDLQAAKPAQQPSTPVSVVQSNE